VTATSASDAWAVGRNDLTGSSLVEHWDGTAWTVVPTPAGSGGLDEVAAKTPGTAWAVGSGDASQTNGIALRLRAG